MASPLCRTLRETRWVTRWGRDCCLPRTRWGLQKYHWYYIWCVIFLSYLFLMYMMGYKQDVYNIPEWSSCKTSRRLKRPLLGTNLWKFVEFGVFNCYSNYACDLPMDPWHEHEAFTVASFSFFVFGKSTGLSRILSYVGE